MSTEIKEARERKTEKQVVSPKKEEQIPPIRGGQLASFGERVTYTFLHEGDVGSIHYDRMRGEIFYKGHNIRNMELSESHMQILEKMRSVLKNAPQESRFAETYGKTLDKIVLEKSRAPRSSP